GTGGMRAGESSRWPTPEPVFGLQQLPLDALDALANRVAHFAIDGELVILAACGFARVRKAPVQALPGTEENRARFVGLVADSDHLVEWLVEVALERLALLCGD